jgi:hypothetical protein
VGSTPLLELRKDLDLVDENLPHSRMRLQEISVVPGLFVLK